MAGNKEEAASTTLKEYRVIETIPFLSHEEVVKLKGVTLEGLYKTKQNIRNTTLYNWKGEPVKGILWPHCPHPYTMRVEPDTGFGFIYVWLTLF